jgi:hypothetical protein
VLPLAVSTAGAVVDICVPVAVPVKIVVVIDVDVAAAPIAVAPPVIRDAGAYKDTGAKGQSHSRVITGIGIGIVGIGRRTVNDRWIVRRNINGLRIRLLNNNDLLVVLDRFSLDRLLLAGLERAFTLRFHTHSLHGIQHVLLLREESVPNVGGPLDVRSQSRNHVRHGGH